MALGRRRWPLFAAASILFLYMLFSLRDNRSVSRPLTEPFSKPAQAADARFRWHDVPIQHPINNPRSLPVGRPQQLPRIQHTFEIESAAEEAQRLQRRDKVKAAFQKCYKSYKERAWMKDELSPVSGGSRNAFGGWAATLVDSLDTLYIMGMYPEFEHAAKAIVSIDFSSSTEITVNVFETTIRYLGGFLAAYDLSGNKAILDKAIEIGEMLLVAFDTPNHMPNCRWDWKKAADGQAQIASEFGLVSELGSLNMEFTRLSQVTQDMRWYDAVARITDFFDLQQAATKLPGMWPVSINPRDMVMTKDTWFTLGGMSDSLYEYFPKMYALLGGLEPVYKKLYDGSMEASIRHLLFRPMVPRNEDILISGNVRANGPAHITLEPQGQHLGCFVGGMLALGGRLFNIPEHVSLGRKVTDGCVWAYNALPMGLMPETFHLVPCTRGIDCKWDTRKYTDAIVQKHRLKSELEVDATIVSKRLAPGFTDIGDQRYILRPEAIESVFILYRITGDKSLQEAAWKMFTTIQNLTETEFGNAALNDVTVTNTFPPKQDRMESFWMAETLKYFYLIFSEPELISLDDFVLNTEAHPLRRPK